MQGLGVGCGQQRAVTYIPQLANRIRKTEFMGNCDMSGAIGKGTGKYQDWDRLHDGRVTAGERMAFRRWICFSGSADLG